MADKLKGIPAKVLEWWNKFTTKQRTIIIAMTAVVVFTFIIVIYAFTRPQYVQLIRCESTTQSAKVIDILDGAGIYHRDSTDTLTIEVEERDQARANYALASAGFVPDELKMTDFLQSGMTVTSADKEKQWQEYNTAKLTRMFSTIGAVEDVDIILNVPDQVGSLLGLEQESSAYIQLKLKDTFSAAQAAGMARAAATALGNATTANITIVDQNSNVLFSGGDDYMNSDSPTNSQELREQAEAMVANQLKRVLLGTNQFDNVEVASRLSIDFAEYERTVKEYSVASGREEGYLAERDQYNSESTNGVMGVPGTTSNDGNDNTSYVNPDNANGESSSSEMHEKFLPNEMIEHQTILSGGINYEESSMGITMVSYRDYHEESVKRQGLLEGITWEEFKSNNEQDVKLEVDEDYYRLAANATGISQDRITIIAYESPRFFDKPGLSVSGTDILSIVMILLILGVLAFVVLRSMWTKKEAVEEQQEELPVESMLQSTPEAVVETFEVETKSEQRQMIEQFVDENPEAVASLLRNWLNEEWS